MTGKDLLKGIQNLDGEFIEEAEFGVFPKSKPTSFGKKKFLLLLAAVLVLLATLTAATVYTRWSATMQYGNHGGAQPSEQLKRQADQSGLVVVPTEEKDGEQKTISATDNGITVTLIQTVMDENGGKAVFRIQGLKLEEGQAPWAWYDYLIDGKDWTQLHISGGSQFFNGIVIDDAGNPVYAKNGKPIVDSPEKGWIPEYQLADGSIEFSVDFSWTGVDVFGKEMVFTFTGFGIQGEKFEDEDIMTHPGVWELRWTLEGSTQAPRKWMPNAKIGDWDLTLVEAEIGQYSTKMTYRPGAQYQDIYDFTEKTGWDPTPASFRLKDGTDVKPQGGSGGGSWDPDTRLTTVVYSCWTNVLDPDQIVGISFYSGYELNDQGYLVKKPYYYIPLE